MSYEPSIRRQRFRLDEGKCLVRTDWFDPDVILVSSEVRCNGLPCDLHMPAIDLDVPAHYEPSSTPGHGHLYIDVAMSWRKYRRLLKALVEAGLVEPGYYRASKARRATMLRLPGVTKGSHPDLPKGDY